MISRDRPLPRPDLIRIANGSTLVLGATVFGLGLTYIYNIFLARYFGAAGYGLYSLGLATYSMLSMVAVAGLDFTMVKFVPVSIATGDRAHLRRTVGIILGVSLASGCLFGGAVLAGSGAIARISRQPEIARLLFLVALCIPAYTVSSVLMSTLQAFKDVRWRTSVKYVAEPVSRIIFTLLLLWAGWTITAPLAALLAALLLSGALSAIPLRHLVTKAPSSAQSQASAGSVITYSLPLLCAFVAGGIAAKADVLLVGFWGLPRDVGIYSAALQSAGIIALVLQSFESIANPLISSSIARNDWHELDRLYKVLLRWVVILSLPACVILGFFSSQILALFGKSFEGGGICLVVLIVGQLVNAATGSANNILIFANRTRLVMWNFLFFAVFQIVMNVVLIPRYGIVGAAMATSISAALVNTVRVVQVFLLFGVHPYEATIWKPFAAALGSSAIMWALEAWSPVRPVALLAAGIVPSYFICLVALGLEDDDVAVLRAVLTIQPKGLAVTSNTHACEAEASR